MNDICKELRNELLPFISGEGDAPTRTTISRHLQVCPDCQRELNQIQALSKLVQQNSIHPEPMSQALKTKILAGLPKHHAPAFKLTTFLPAFGVCLILICAIGMGFNRWSNTGDVNFETVGAAKSAANKSIVASRELPKNESAPTSASAGVPTMASGRSEASKLNKLESLTMVVDGTRIGKTKLLTMLKQNQVAVNKSDITEHYVDYYCIGKESNISTIVDKLSPLQPPSLGAKSAYRTIGSAQNTTSIVIRLLSK